MSVDQWVVYGCVHFFCGIITAFWWGMEGAKSEHSEFARATFGFVFWPLVLLAVWVQLARAHIPERPEKPSKPETF